MNRSVCIGNDALLPVSTDTYFSEAAPVPDQDWLAKVHETTVTGPIADTGCGSCKRIGAGTGTSVQRLLMCLGIISSPWPEDRSRQGRW